MREHHVQVGLGHQIEALRVEAQPVGAHLDLPRAFLAGNVEDRPVQPGHQRGDFQQQRGFADAGVAPDEDE